MNSLRDTAKKASASSITPSSLQQQHLNFVTTKVTRFKCSVLFFSEYYGYLLLLEWMIGHCVSVWIPFGIYVNCDWSDIKLSLLLKVDQPNMLQAEKRGSEESI